MIHAQRTKTGALFAPASTATNATASGTVDTKGFDYATFDVVLDSAASTSNNPVTLQLKENDNTVATSFATVSGYVGDTDFTIPNADTANPQVVKFNVDLRARKRYLEVEVTPGTAAQILACTYTLGRATDDGQTSNQGCATVVNG